MLSVGGKGMLSDEEFADSLLQITQRTSKYDDLSKQRCGVCGTTNTPCWRKGPAGPKTLCNRCGVHWYQNKDRWDIIVEELRATRMDETVEQAAAPTRTVIKKKVDARGEAVPVVPDSQRCVKSNGRGWRCSQRKVSGYSYCAHHQRNWDGHEKQWRKAFPNLVYPRKSKKLAPAADSGAVRKRERKPKPKATNSAAGARIILPVKTWKKANRDSDGSSEPDYVDSRFGKVRTKGKARSPGLVNEGSGSMVHLVLPSETETRPLARGYMSEDDDSQLYHGTQLSEEPGESLESVREVRSPNRADHQPKQAISYRSEITALSPPLKPISPTGLRACNAKRPSAFVLGGSEHCLEDGGETLNGMDILLRLQLKRKRSAEDPENGFGPRGALTGPGFGLTWKTKMRRRPFSSRGGPVADVKQGSDMSQDSPRPKLEIDPPETEWGGQREEEDDAAYLGTGELKRRLEQNRGAIFAQQERNDVAARELMRAREGRLMAEKRLEDAQRGGEMAPELGGGDVEKLRKAVLVERTNGAALGPEALKLADQYQHQAVLLAKQSAHLSDLRTSTERLQLQLAALASEKKELQAQLTHFQKANACTLCTSAKPASSALVPCGHLFCNQCTSELVPQVGDPFPTETPVQAPLILAPVQPTGASGVVNGKEGTVDKVSVESGLEGVRTSRCPCCSVEVKGRLVVQKPAQVDEEMDGAVSLLGLLASESSQ